MNAFLEGFSDLVPLPVIKLFDEHELELLMCGIQHIDVKDWKQNTVYKGDYHVNHIVIQWFWRVSTLISIKKKRKEEGNPHLQWNFRSDSTNAKVATVIV